MGHGLWDQVTGPQVWIMGNIDHAQSCQVMPHELVILRASI